MLFGNSLKQMGRTKIKTSIFFLLIILAVTLLSLGINIWQSCNENMNEYEKIFTTVGVVNQKEDGIKVNKTWEAALKKYYYSNEPVYDTILPDSILNFEGANYILEPRQRPYYGAYCPEIYVNSLEDLKRQVGDGNKVIEFEVYEDSIPSQPVRINIKRVLWGRGETGEAWLCAHFNDSPGLLKVGKTYISFTQAVLNMHDNSDNKGLFELIVYSNPIISTQKNKKGELLTEISENQEIWTEVTDDFDESEEWQRWSSLMSGFDRFYYNTVPVVPIDKTKLLMDFYLGSANIIDGRDITEEEYRNGKKVCLISKESANINNLNVGDKINLQMYFADYDRPVSLVFHPAGGHSIDKSLLNAGGELYPVFEEGKYEIVGTYGSSKTKNPTGYECGRNQVIVPFNSIQHSDENNIKDFGPMKGYNTSFQIPNGTMTDYMEKFKSLGIDNIEITLYDGGYEKLKAGMENLKMVAFILLITSGATTMALLFFFIFLFIAKEKKRTAIERSLGMTRRECEKSMLYGMMGVISVGALFGCSAGYLIAKFAMPALTSGRIEQFSTAYSSWVNNSDKVKDVGLAATNGLTSILLFLIILVVSYSMAITVIHNNLKAEPLTLLSKRGNL